MFVRSIILLACNLYIWFRIVGIQWVFSSDKEILIFNVVTLSYVLK